MKNKNKKNSKTYMDEILDISKQISISQEAIGVGMIAAYFLIYTLSIINITPLIALFNLDKTLFINTLKFLLLYSPLIVISSFSKMMLSQIATVKYKYGKNLLINFFNTSIIALVSPCEFLIFPLKAIIFCIFVCSQELRLAYIGEGYQSYIYIIWILVDFLITLGITETKVNLMRGFSPNAGFFSKADGLFEETITVVMPVVFLLEVLSSNPQESSMSYWVYFSAKAVLLMILEVIYLKDLPYFGKLTEQVFGHILSLFVVFMMIFGAARRDINTALKVWCFLIPFQIICLVYYFKNVYSVNFLSRNHGRNFLVIKKILLNCFDEQPTEDKIFEMGVFKNHLQNGKGGNSEYLKIWKMKIDLKKNGNHKELQEENQTLSEEDRIGLDQENHSKKILNKIHSQVLNDFIKNSHGSTYSHLLKIIWMLDNQTILHEVLRSLRRMLERGKSFKEKFMYRYAKRIIQNRFKDYYFHKEMNFKTDSLEEKNIIKIEQELKKINEVGVDLAYAFRYRDGIEEMVRLIQEFTEENKGYIKLLETQTKLLKELNTISSKLYALKGKIEFAFDRLHSQTRNVHAVHLTPYFYFLVKNVNLHRSASKIFKIYKQRMLNKKNLVDEKLMILKDVNLFSQSLIFMIESKAKDFGKILEVYGDSKYLKVNPNELKNTHMDSLIMESQRGPHTRSCEIFNEGVISPIIGDTVKSFIKLPTKNLVLPVTYNIKIIPYEETDFKFVVGVKYNRSDSKMYILLDQANRIDSFSYNMKHIFRKGENFLDSKRSLGDLSKECQDRVRKLDRQMRSENRADSEQPSTHLLTDPSNARKVNNLVNEFESKPSFSNFGSNMDREFPSDSDDGWFQAKLRFQNKYSGKIAKRYFRVKIEMKNYVLVRYSFKILTLEMEDQDKKKSGIIEPDEKGLTIENRIQKKEEKEEEHLPPIETDRCNVTHTIRNSNAGYKFIKNITVSSKDSTEKKPGLGEIKEGEEAPEVNLKAEKAQKKSTILDDETVFDRSNMEKKPKVKFEEIGKILKEEENDDSIESEKLIRILEEKESFLKSGKFEIYNSIEEDEFDENKNFSDLNKKHKMIDGTGSVFSNSNIQTHKKYFAFEDAVNKTAGLREILSIIVLYFLSLGATIFFTIYIQSELKVKNLEFETGNDIYTAFCEHTLESQMFFNKLLSAVAYNKGIYAKDRYAKYNFSDNPLLSDMEAVSDYKELGFDLADFESYSKYQIEASRDNMIRLLNKIYKYMGEFGDNNKKFFEKKISYFQHEINGTAVKKSMGIYQGYLLLTTTKVIEIANLDIKTLQPESLNRDVLYFLDNSMNGIPEAFEAFNDFLYQLMTTNYYNFMAFVYLCLFIIIGLTVILMISSICSILKIKNMFWEIYQSYLGITKSEFDERTRQLNMMSKMMSEFKESNYFKDLMSFNDFSLPKKTSSKKGKKYTDSIHCFNLLYSVGFIGLFYIIQICFSSGMMLIFKGSVDKGVWICVKQNDLKQVLMDEFFFYNTIKQSLVLGKDKKVFGNSLDEYIPKLKELTRKDTDTIMKLFEDRDTNAYEPLKDYFNSHSNSSLCDYSKKIKSRKELCYLLDNKLPLRGIVQVYFRISQYIEEVYSQMKTETFDATDLLNDSEYIELEYSFENVYYWTFVFLEHEAHEFFEDFVFIAIDEDVALIINLMIIFIAVSFFFTIFSFKNIINQVSRITFTFQLLSINTVINNTGIKYRFLKVYRLNQKHF